MNSVLSRGEAADSPSAAQALDAGLAALAIIASYYRIAADAQQMRHQLALTGRFAGADDIARGANHLQLRSRILRRVTAKRLTAIPYPAILGLRTGRFGILAVGSERGRARLIDPIALVAQELAIDE